jgi:multicomponent Na+:H+ antiporter subunit F
MTGVELPLAGFLLLNLAITLLVATRGPTAADRMLIALLFGTTGVAILVLLAYAGGATELVDVALVLALLAAFAGITFARRTWTATGGGDG